MRILLVFLAVGFFGDRLIGQDVEANLIHALGAYGLADAVDVLAVEGDSVYLVPRVGVDGVDRLALDLSDESKWRKNCSLCTHWGHHGIAGWRATALPSAHLTMYRAPDGSIFYEGHVDLWPGSIRNLRCLFLHFFREYLPGKFGKRANQEAIRRRLDKRDHRVAKAYVRR